MADSKKYYYLKLKDNFFDSEQMIILESLPDGHLYSNILLKLFLRSLKNNGRLMFNDKIPYDAYILSKVVRQPVGVVEKAIQTFKDFGLIDIMDNGAIYMLDIQNFIGESSTEADRQRNYQHRISQDKVNKRLLPKNIVPKNNVKCKKSNMKSNMKSNSIPTPELELELEIELEIERERERDIKIKIDYPQEFESFYFLYPNTNNKAQTFKNYKSFLIKHKDMTPQDIITCTKQYISEINQKGTLMDYVTISTNFVGKVDKCYGIWEKIKAVEIKSSIPVVPKQFNWINTNTDEFRKAEAIKARIAAGVPLDYVEGEIV